MAKSDTPPPVSRRMVAVHALGHPNSPPPRTRWAPPGRGRGGEPNVPASVVVATPYTPNTPSAATLAQGNGSDLTVTWIGSLAAGPRLSFAPWHVTRAIVEMWRQHRMSTARLASFEPELGHTNPPGNRLPPSVWPDVEPRRVARPQGAAWESSPPISRKRSSHGPWRWGCSTISPQSRSQGFVVSLSGGADSSAVSCLVALMVELAYARTGRRAFQATPCDTLPAWPRPRPSPDAVRRRLSALRLPGDRNSSAETRHVGHDVGPSPGAEMSCLTIDRLVQGYVAGIEKLWADHFHGKRTTSPCKISRPGSVGRVSGC